MLASARGPLLLLLAVVLQTGAIQLPHYIKPCARSDPDFNECAKQSAIKAIPQFIHGDPKYKVPPLEPMLISEIYVAEGTRSVGMTMQGNNATLYGLKDVIIKEFRFDFDKQHIEYDWFFPKLDIKVKYKVSGRILLLPITGTGPGQFSMKNITASFKYDYDLVKKKDKKQYMVPKNPHLDFDAKGLTIKLENLFNGDKFLGDNMNRFMNENWDVLMKDIGPAIADALSEYIRQLLTNIFQLVPFDEAIPEKL